MSSRVFICALVAILSISISTALAHGKTEAECLAAIRAGNRLISEDPNNYRGYASRGGAYGYLKKYDLAEKDLLKAISLNPTFAGLYAHLAAVYNETKRYKKAAIASRKAIELGADSEEAYNALLANLWMANYFDECVHKSDEVLVKFPEDAAAYFYRAIAKNALGKFAKSEVLSDLSKAHSLRPSDEGLTKMYNWAMEGKFQNLKSR